MRPLDKGPVPSDENDVAITVNDYDLWRKHLINRIGYYCVYCNQTLSHNLQVEHVVPKNPPVGYVPGDPLAWENMLLACGPCNRAKWNTPIDFSRYYFPEENNTLLPFSVEQHENYPESAIVIPSDNLDGNQIGKSVATIQLMDLNVIDQRDRIVDIRHLKRKDAMNAVEVTYHLYQETKTNNPGSLNDFAKLIALNLKCIGFFGMWFRKFKDEPIVLEALLDNEVIPGTAQCCFDTDNNFVLLPRNPTNPFDPI
ncbi:HNH endonuclease [compost metagenome]